MQNIDYKAIARRFRPKTFSEVTGQDSVVQTLKNALRLKKASHAYLFSGIRGTGKTTLARLFAKALNCENLSEECEPCNTCASCLEISAGRSLDVIEIDGASNRGIDDIRNLNETLGYKARNDRYKILLIDEVHMLTKEAFNALLKSLEEPPANVKFFLCTTEMQKVLPTIVSRCQRFDLSRIPNGLIMQKLRRIGKELGIEIEDEALGFLAKLSEGSLRDAESLFDQVICLGETPITADVIINGLGFVQKEHFFSLDRAFGDGDIGFAFTLAGELFGGGRDMTFFLDNLLEHYRNIALILLKKIEIDALVISENDEEGYLEATKIYTISEVLYILNFLSNLIYQSSRPSFKKIHIEMILLHIIESKKRIPLASILEALSKEEGAINIEKPRVISEDDKKPSFKESKSALEVQSSSKRPIPDEAVLSEKSVISKEMDKKESISSSLRQENLMRFAGVELGGVIKKTI